MSKYNNVVLILLDSLSYSNMDYLNTNFPLVEKYKENMVLFNNVFSQAPYTEAALISLLTGSRTLDYNGYLMNIESRPNNINSIFKDLGYKTYNSLWYYPNIESFKKDVDDYYYIHSFSYYVLYSYRIKYYIELYKNNQITDKDIELLSGLFERFLLSLSEYVDDYFNQNYRFDVIRNCSNLEELNFNEYKRMINEEIDAFNKNRKEYVYDVLMEKRSNLYGIKDVTINQSSAYKEVYGDIKLRCIRKSLSQLVKTILSSSKNKSGQVLFDKAKEAVKTKKKSPLVTGLMYTLNYTGKPAYDMVSCKNTLRHISKYLIENKDNKNFVYNHTNDTHFPFNFFSSDLNDKNLIEYEYEEFKKNIKKSKYKNIFFEMSIKYCNDAVEGLIDTLRDNDILDDTLLVITSDHGISYLGEMFRKEKVCTFYEENYKVPLMIYNPNLEGKVIDNLGSAIDFIPTILDIMNVDHKKYNMDGKSIINSGNEYVIYEYYGAGCPDYIRRDKLFAIKGNKYKVTTEVNNTGELHINEIYDLINDPNELENRKESLINDDSIKDMLLFLNKRIEEMRLR